MPFSAYGDPIAGCSDGKLATWVNTAGVISYGTPVDIMSIQMFGSALDVVNAELTGDDRITAMSSRTIAGEISVRFGGFLVEVLQVALGLTPTLTGTTPNRVSQFMIYGGKRLPYIGLGGLGLAEEGLGDMLVFVPKAKITSQIRLTSMEYGSFQVAEFTMRAVDDEDYGIINLVRRETTGAFTLPPAGIATL